jgi:acetylornithine deacetylase/succinyl-diaminopimelate desuccinylase-like protein
LANLGSELVERIRAAVNVDRLVDTAVKLIGKPSPTCEARPAADQLAEILTDDGFDVSRPEADWPSSPAVIARYDTGRPGRVIQFNGHLDTVHLPFVAPRVSDGRLYGSGASDMKGGVAAMCEAARVLKETDSLPGGGVLITGADLHEAPWGDQRQLRALIRDGFVGDGILIPEYVADRLPVMGRGMAVIRVQITRDGPPVHEVMGGLEQPRVIAAGAELISRFDAMDGRLADLRHPLGDRESVFIGQVHAGEIFNQSPTELTLEGTRRWLPGTTSAEAEAQCREEVEAVGRRDGISAECEYMHLSDPFELDQTGLLAASLQTGYGAATGKELPFGGKPFLDDGNIFMQQSSVAAITHGPAATGAHTIDEEAPISELERVALVYALTAICFCGGNPP